MLHAAMNVQVARQKILFLATMDAPGPPKHGILDVQVARSFVVDRGPQNLSILSALEVVTHSLGSRRGLVTQACTRKQQALLCR